MKFVDISTPIYDSDHQFNGVLATHLSWEWVKEVEQSMLTTLQDHENIEFVIVSQINNDVILGPEEMLGKPLQLKSVELARENKTGWKTEKWSDGKEYLTGYVLADGYEDYLGLDWVILVRQPVEVAYSPVTDLLSFIVIIGLFLVILFAVIGWFAAGIITRPLTHITIVADDLSEGKDVEIPPYKGVREMEILSNSLRKLVTSLMKTENALVEIQEVAHHDHLTGLPNRIALDIYLEKTTQKYDALSILFLDLDGFKAVNDTLGHPVGDKLLIQVSSRLKNCIQNDELVSRVGGDEFVVILIPMENPGEHGRLIGEQMISLINEPFDIDGNMVHIGTSIGGAVWYRKKDNISEVIRRADNALYEVKRSEKNKVRIID